MMANPAAIPPVARFIGKVVVLTASTQGIGLATAERVGREGAKVVVSSRKQNNVDEAVKKLRDLNIEVSGIVCHQGNKDDRLRLIDHAVTKYGKIDHLFINAGVNPHTGDFLTITEIQWDKIFDINLKSVFLLIRECLPHMNQNGGASIVTMSTSNSYVLNVIPAQMLAGYALSKLGQVSLVKTLAGSLADKNIRINAVAPGPIDTSFYAGAFPGGRDEMHLITPYVRFLKRIGIPEEIASVVAFLLSNDASYISGDCVTACGGYTCRL